MSPTDEFGREFDWSQQDGIHEADEWVDPFHHLQWTLNRTALAVVGDTVRPEADYPCEAPFPCVAIDGRRFRPGRAATLTLHQARGRDLINEADTINLDLCRHHYGAETINHRGRMVPVIFSLPNNADSYHVESYFASIGVFTIGDATDRPDDDLLSLCGPGRECGVVALQLPEWIEGLFDSQPVTCGDPI